MRLLAGLLLLAALPAAAGASDTALPPLDEALRGLGPIAVPLGEAPSVHDAVSRAVRAPPAAVDPVSGAVAPPHRATGAGPAQPSLGAAGEEVLLWLLGFGGAATAAALGWRHLHRRNVLDHPARATLLALVRARPGLHLRGLARAAGLPVQRAAYHLDALQRLGLVASHDLVGRRCYFEAGVGSELRRALAEAAGQPGPTAREVRDFVAAHPGASQSDVARHLGLLPGSARWHLRRLTERGDLAEAREGRALTYRPREPGPSSGPRP